MRAPKLILAAGLAATGTVAGCTRAHYRKSADRETYPILAERESMQPGYDIGRLQVEPAPGSRLADPLNPDKPPKPPDDPAAGILMGHPYKFKGSSHWGRYGYTDRIEPPGWEAAVGLDDAGVLKLDQDKAAAVALLNSREYQTALEAVYLTALSLTLNRFEFDVRWFGRNTTSYTQFGTSAFPTETNTLSSITNVGFDRNFAAGGQLLVDFANNVVYEYTGGTGRVRSNLLFSLVQPLLRGFGRQVRLESLTQAERDVLYAVRDFARFRKSFWVDVTTQNGGYLDLLLQAQRLRNAEANLKLQDETYRLYNELFRGGRASVVDLDLRYQGLLQARQQVLDARLFLENAQDSFKLTLGVPPRMPVELDDTPLNRFILTDPAAEKLRDDLEAFQRARLRELDAPPPAADLRAAYAQLRGLADRIPAVSTAAAADLAAFEKRLARPARPDDDPEQRDRDKTTYAGLKTALADTNAELVKQVARLDAEAAAVAEGKRKESWEAVTLSAKRVLALLNDVIGVQTQSRIYTIELPEAGGEEGPLMAYAKENRLDLQNRLGLATDAWRKVTVAANALRGGVNVVASANLATDPDHDNPFNFAAEANSYTVGLQLDAPLNRLAERNAYRASLITYQRAKRAYVLLSDQIEQQIRRDLRQLRRLRVGFEIARQQLLSAARQVENTRLELVAPQEAGRGGGAGADTAALQLQTALNSLLQARNDLANQYVQFEQQRLQLLLDLEELQLDPRGFPTNAAPRAADPAGGPGVGRNGPGDAGPSDPGIPPAPGPGPLPGVFAPQPLGPPRPVAPKP